MTERATLKNILEEPWTRLPGHSPGALSKLLVGPAGGAEKIGYNLSTYSPGDRVRPHAHAVREQVYHFLSGEGVLVIDGERHRVGPGDVAFMPPGVEHALCNEGLTDLVFVVASGPAEEPR